MTQWMSWADFMRLCHEGRGLPREVLKDLDDLEIDDDDEEEDA